jgi:small subunit ribosomal protein S20
VKSLRKKALEAAQSGNAERAQTALKEFGSAVDRAQKKGLFHKNKAANLKRKSSRASKAGAAASA